jgi:hypothetical protein
MPVVINEFEVVADEQAHPTQTAPATPQEPSAQAGRGATPHEVENILRREKERLARVQAH